MLTIAPNIHIPDNEIELRAIRSQGSGGQNVNKVSTAIHLRFDYRHSSLPQFYKDRLAQVADQRISTEGIIVIKAQQFRTQEKNKTDALERLRTVIQQAAIIREKRRDTKPTKTSKVKRVDRKTRRGKIKQLRRKVF